MNKKNICNTPTNGINSFRRFKFLISLVLYLATILKAKSRNIFAPIAKGEGRSWEPSEREKDRVCDVILEAWSYSRRWSLRSPFCVRDTIAMRTSSFSCAALSFFTLQGEKGGKGDPGPMGLPVRIFSPDYTQHAHAHTCSFKRTLKRKRGSGCLLPGKIPRKTWNLFFILKTRGFSRDFIKTRANFWKFYLSFSGGKKIVFFLSCFLGNTKPINNEDGIHVTSTLLWRANFYKEKIVTIEDNASF